MDGRFEVFDGIRSGDRRAWEALVRGQASRLHAIAWAITRDAGLAEDSVQETFLRLLERRPPRLADKAALVFLARVTTRLAIDLLRRRETRRKREEVYAMAKDAQEEPPAGLIEAAETRAQVAEGFLALPAEHRAAIWLHFVEGEGVREVAAAIGCSRSTAWDRIQSGTQRLREFLGRRGCAVPAIVTLRDLLGRTAPQTAPPALVDRLQRLGESLAPRGAGAVSLLSLGVFIMSEKKLTVAAVLAVLLFLGFGLAIVEPIGLRERLRAPPEAALVQQAPGELATSADPPRPEPTTDPAQFVQATPPEPEKLAEALVSLRGTVFDAETGAAVAGARFRPHGGQKPNPVPGMVVECESDAEGRVELLLPSSFTPTYGVSAEGYAPGTVSSNTSERDLVIPLTPVRMIQGWVLDADGEPLPGAEVDFGGISRGRSTTYDSNCQKSLSGEDGSFVVRPYMVGQARLVVQKAGHGGTVFLGAPPGASGLKIRVPRGAIVSGRVVDGDGHPAAGQTVRWTTIEPSYTGWSGLVSSGEDGRFEIAGLPAPGLHQLCLGDSIAGREARREDADRFIRRVRVEPGQIVEDVVLA